MASAGLACSSNDAVRGDAGAGKGGTDASGDVAGASGFGANGSGGVIGMGGLGAGGAAAVSSAGAAGALQVGGMGGAGADTGDDELIVPAVSVMPLSGGNGVLRMFALTLRRGANGAELFAALKNEGDMPACDAGLSVQLYDDDQQSLGAGIAGLSTKDFYRMNDGSGTLTSCVAPGSVTMATITSFTPPIDVDQVGYVVYQCPYFALDVSPVAGLSVEQVQAVPLNAGSAYTGVLVNGLDVAVSEPAVTLFSVNGVGRPLGVATASSTDTLAPGATWMFQTSAVDATGSSYAAFPSATLPP